MSTRDLPTQPSKTGLTSRCSSAWLGFYLGAAGQNSGPDAFQASTLLWEPSAQTPPLVSLQAYHTVSQSAIFQNTEDSDLYQSS